VGDDDSRETTMKATMKTNNDCVVMLHGLARTANSMNKMADAFKAKGYHTVNLGYPSRSDSIEKLARQALKKAIDSCKRGPGETEPSRPTQQGKIHFVTHSMGGILLRQYLSVHEIKNLGRTVMIAPPNQGSEVVDSLGKVPGFKLFNGPAGMQLGTNEDSIPLLLGPVDFPVGIIAGDRSINPLLSKSLPKPNDGKVSVESTKVEGMADFIQFPLNHTFIMRNEQVIRQSITFVETGAFRHARQ